MIPFLISPPFGSYIDLPNSESVLGSFTLHPRRGRWLKTAEFFWDNFRRPVPGGYVNHIGLRNKGIQSVQFTPYHLHLYSLVGLEEDDWAIMYDYVRQHADTHIRFELNVGCPNVHEYGIDFASLEKFCHRYWCGVKLPADLKRAFTVAEAAVLAGARYLHIGNTLASERGGISGYPLKSVNLEIVEALAKLFPDVNIVGGGGIYTFDDLVDYRNAGANSYSLATVWFKPWKALAIMKQYDEIYGCR